MTKASQIERTERYKQLLAACAEQLGLLETDDSVQRLALLKLQREDLAIRILAGAKVDTLELLRLDDAIATATPPVSTSHTVTITLVPPEDGAKPGDGSIGGLAACRRCGWSPPKGDVVQRCYRCGIGPHGDHDAPFVPLLVETPSPTAVLAPGAVAAPEANSKPTADVPAAAAVPDTNKKPFHHYTPPADTNAGSVCWVGFGQSHGK